MSDFKGTQPRPIKTCSDSHEEIAYYGGDCPLCKQRLELDHMLDDREDIDQANIEQLFKEIKRLDKSVKGLELVLGVRHRKLWNLLPIRYTRSAPEPWAERSTFEH
jgi:DNA repair exonuclease SbcCD ATPase subunit